jgi:hypothetical protein
MLLLGAEILSNKHTLQLKRKLIMEVILSNRFQVHRVIPPMREKGRCPAKRMMIPLKLCSRNEEV